MLEITEQILSHLNENIRQNNAAVVQLRKAWYGTLPNSNTRIPFIRSEDIRLCLGLLFMEPVALMIVEGLSSAQALY